MYHIYPGLALALGAFVGRLVLAVVLTEPWRRALRGYEVQLLMKSKNY